MDVIRLIARPLLAAPFIRDGISAVRDPEPHVEKARELVPLAQRFGVELSDQDLVRLTRILGGVSAGAGVLLALGRHQRLVSGVLAITSIPLALANNPFWKTNTAPHSASTSQRCSHVHGLTRSGAIFAGLIFAAADREGQPSAAWKLENWRSQRRALADTKAQAWEDARQTYRG